MKKIYIIIIFSQVLLQGFSQQRTLDSLDKIVKSNVHDSVKLFAMHEMMHYLPQDKALEVNTQIIKHASQKAKNFAPGTEMRKLYMYFLADGYYSRGTLLSYLALYDSALVAYKKSLVISNEIGNDQYIAYCKTSMGWLYMNRSDYLQAVKMLYESLKTLEKMGDHEAIAENLSNIGTIYYKQKNFPKAIETFEKAYKAFEKVSSATGMADMYYKLSVIYTETGQYEKSLEYVHKSIEALDHAGEREQGLQQAMLNMNLGFLYYRQNNMEKAIYHLKKRIELGPVTGNISGLGGCYLHLGQAYLKLKNYSDALKNAQKALEISKQTNDVELEYKGADLLHLLYKVTGNFKQALVMNEASAQLKDSVQNEKTRLKVLEQQFKYEYEKKALLEKSIQDKQINELEVSAERKNFKKNIWIIILIFVFVLLAAGAYFAFNYFRQKNIITSQKNNILQQKLLVSQMNPNFIFNSLNAIQNYIMSQNSLKAGIYLSQFAELIRMILDFSRKEYISLESELKFLKNYLELQQLRFDHKFEYEFCIDDTLAMDMVLVPPMLAQPFIENAIEHRVFYKKGKGHLSIAIRKKEDALIYIIEDDGVGIEAHFNEDKKHESFAVKITTERIEMLYAGKSKNTSIEIFNKKETNAMETGVKVTFGIPYEHV